MTTPRRIQCKDIPDDVFLDAVRRTPGVSSRSSWRMRNEVQDTLQVTMGPIPENLVLAKARRLMARGLLGGCPCGCRGDYHLPEDCDDGLCCPKPDQEPFRRPEGWPMLPTRARS